MKHIIWMPLVVLGCAGYTPPEADGLTAVRAFPSDGHVCQVIAEGPLTTAYLDDSATLIGCPLHERGAIADRKRAGAMPVATIGRWQLFSTSE